MRRLSRRTLVIGAVAASLAAACRASASAAMEFCPARLEAVYPKTVERKATTQYYHLQALAARTVEGTIVADTDAGWFTWTQQPVGLTRTTYMTSSPTVKYWFHAAESPELTVVFPQPVTVRRAWLATAQAHGDRYFDWDAHGSVTCDPPDFGVSPVGNGAKTTRSPAPGDETPPPAPPPANALAAAAPFSIASCPKPFVAARVTSPVQPDFPRIVRSEGFAGSAVAVVAIAVDPQGRVVDAWMWANSGYPAIDTEALKAARLSKYEGATSYCRAVHGTYLFLAEFLAQ